MHLETNFHDTPIFNTKLVEAITDLIMHIILATNVSLQMITFRQDWGSILLQLCFHVVHTKR